MSILPCRILSITCCLVLGTAVQYSECPVNLGPRNSPVPTTDHWSVTNEIRGAFSIYRARQGKTEERAIMAENPPDQRTAMIKEAFSRFDKDGKGTINIQELKPLARSVGFHPTDAELRDMIQEVDKDGSGSAGLTEIITLMTRKLQEDDPNEELKEAFRVFDKDGDGLISLVELRHSLMTLDHTLKDEDLQLMMKEADSDGDGFLSLDGRSEIRLLSRIVEYFIGVMTAK